MWWLGVIGALVLPTMGWCVTELVPGEYVIDDSVPVLKYEPKEILHVPYGDSKPGIPLYKRLLPGHPNSAVLRRREPREGVFHLEVFNVTDEGWFLLATGGPKAEDRWIYVFDDDGKMQWQVQHQEPWVDSIDMDDQGRVILFVIRVQRIDLNEQGFVQVVKNMTATSYAAFYDSTSHREILNTPAFNRGDVSAALGQWLMRSPYFYAGNLYSCDQMRCKLEVKVDDRPRRNKPILFGTKVSLDGNAGLTISNTSTAASATYRFKLAEGERLVAPQFVGGERAGGFFSRFFVGSDGKGGGCNFLKVDQKGVPQGVFKIVESKYLASAGFVHADRHGRIFWCYTVGPVVKNGITVVRWGPAN